MPAGGLPQLRPPATQAVADQPDPAGGRRPRPRFCCGGASPRPRGSVPARCARAPAAPPGPPPSVLRRCRRRDATPVGEPTVGKGPEHFDDERGERELRPWRTVEQVEIATLEYVDCFNHRHLFEACGDVPPAELEAARNRHHAGLAEAGHSSPQVSGHASQGGSIVGGPGSHRPTWSLSGWCTSGGGAAFASLGTLWIWDSETGQPRHVLTGHTSDVYALAVVGVPLRKITGCPDQPLRGAVTGARFAGRVRRGADEQDRDG